MTASDLINAGFEFVGSISIWMNVSRIRKDKGYAGMSLFPIIFFLSWGFWNLYYYPSLSQWLSFSAGCSITLANLVWVAHLLYYGKLKNEEYNSNTLGEAIRST